MMTNSEANRPADRRGPDQPETFSLNAFPTKADVRRLIREYDLEAIFYTGGYRSY
jgi:hypothetical protein